MDLELSLPVSVGIVFALIVVGVGGLLMGDVMAGSTILMMVLPSMVVFAGVVFGIGVKHGEYRAQ